MESDAITKIRIIVRCDIRRIHVSIGYQASKPLTMTTVAAILVHSLIVNGLLADSVLTESAVYRKRT